MNFSVMRKQMSEVWARLDFSVLRPQRLFDSFTGWITGRKHALRSFSLLRILYGLALLSFLLPSLPDRSFLWGPASWWVDPEAKRRGFDTFDVLITKGSPFWFDVGYFALILLAVALIVGYRTRIVVPLLLIMLVSLQSNNPYLNNGGDVLMRITLSFMLFTDLSGYWSLDARRRRKRGRRNGRSTFSLTLRRLIPAPIANAAHNVGLILCCFQIMLVYVTSGVFKLRGSEWMDGTAFYYALTLDVFQVSPMINELIWQSSLAVMVATWMSVAVQVLWPVMLLWRPSRIVALVTMAGMHLGIAIFLSLWAFSLAMIALDLLFVRDRSWVRLWARVRCMRHRLRIVWGSLSSSEIKGDRGRDRTIDREIVGFTGE